MYFNTAVGALYWWNGVTWVNATGGIPSGGSVGQVLSKATSADYSVTWTDPTTGKDFTLRQTYATSYTAGIWEQVILMTAGAALTLPTTPSYPPTGTTIMVSAPKGGSLTVEGNFNRILDLSGNVLAQPPSAPLTYLMPAGFAATFVASSGETVDWYMVDQGGGSASTAAVLDNVPVGTIMPYGGTAAPTSDWLICDGSAVSRTLYSDLFAAMGATYGAGDGSTTFNLPDLRGRMAVGSGAGVGGGVNGTGKPAGGVSLTARVPGAYGGEEAHTLLTAEAAQKAVTSTGRSVSHTHLSGRYLSDSDGGGWAWAGASGAAVINLAQQASYTESVDHTHNIAGSDATTAHNNVQPFVVVSYIVKAKKTAPSGILASIEAAPVGSITPYGGSAAPDTNWALCDGSPLSRIGYPELYAAIGTTYGVGDGSTTFNLPDLRGRTVLGAGTATGAAGATAHTRGQTGGEETHTLTTAEAAQKAVTSNATDRDLNHQHPQTGYGVSGISGYSQDGTYGNSGYGIVNIYGQQTGWMDRSIDHLHTISGSNAVNGHNTLPPYLGVNYIIRVRPAQVQKYVVAADMSPIGAVTAYGGPTTALPAGWLACDGTSYLRTDYPELFAALGGASSPWGLPSGTTFNVPDLRGRTVLGAGTGTGGGASGTGLPTGGSALTARALGAWAGAETHVLTAAQMPSHNHGGGNHTHSQDLNYNIAAGNRVAIPAAVSDQSQFVGTWSIGYSGAIISSNGSDQAHNNLQPFAVCTYMIKAKMQNANVTTTGSSNKSVLRFTGDGSTTSFTLTHTLTLAANEPFVGMIWEADSSGNPTRQAVADVLYDTFQTVKVNFSRAPASGTRYILTVIG
jgi:microcystin-dependent protein